MTTAQLILDWNREFVASASFLQATGYTWESKYGEHKQTWARVLPYGDEYDVLMSDGSRQNASADGFSTTLEAQQFAEQVLAELTARRDEDPVSRPFQELVNTMRTEG